MLSNLKVILLSGQAERRTRVSAPIGRDEKRVGTFLYQETYAFTGNVQTKRNQY